MRLLEYLEVFHMVVGDHMGSEMSTADGIADVLNYLVRTGEGLLELGGLKGSEVPLQENKFAWALNIPRG
jgi:hypothetical protein